MKKILLFLLTVGLLTACYEDYRLDYEYSTVAFAYVTGGSMEPGTLWRTVVKDEGLQLDCGIYLAGILDNKEERWAEFEIDPTLLDGTSYTLMPTSYYTLSNTSRFVIPAGEFVGRVTITLDSAVFVNDPLAVSQNYAIPFKLVDTSEDSILSTQSTQVLVIKYMNTYEGNYNQEGSFETSSEGGAVLNSDGFENVINYSTVMLDTLDSDGIMHLIGEFYQMKLVVNPDNTVSYKYIPAERTWSNVAAGVSSYDYSAISESATTDDDIDIKGINNNVDPANSADAVAKDNPAYVNAPSSGTWNYVQYNFSGYYYINQSDVYWWVDAARVPAIDQPHNTYLEYYNDETDAWVLVQNVSVNGSAYSDFGNVDPAVYNSSSRAPGCLVDQYNTTSFDVVRTNKVRLYFIADGPQGILEWKINGLAVPAALENSPISTITPAGTNTYDPETYTLNLNYVVDYKYETYQTTVSSTLVWRNRIRDGINEWRR